MEPVSLAVGAVGLAGLFSAVLDALEKIDAYRKFGDESSFAATQLALNQAHFRQWCDRVGIEIAATTAKLRAEHHPKLDDPAVSKLVQRTLQCMKARLDPSEAALKDIDLADVDDDTMLPLLAGDSISGFGAGASPRTASQTRKRANLTSRKAKLRWAFSGKDRIMKQLDQFERLLESLRKLLPPYMADDKGNPGTTLTGTAATGGGVTGIAHFLFASWSLATISH
jgi:hypothetical protein